jgi:predicted RNase H-like HicB family nuclease
MTELHFDVAIDEEGNYCASAKVPDGVLATDAQDVNSLLDMVRDLVALYVEDAGIEAPV